MKPFSLNIDGRVRRYYAPLIMGIMNVTPDSFYEGSRNPISDVSGMLLRAEEMLSEGVDIIDIGGYSTRPGAQEVSSHEETERVIAGIEAVRHLNREIPVSVDTFRASVARAAITAGANIVNDISGGTHDPEMFRTVAELNVPYILTHTRGTPETMQSMTDYPAGVTVAVATELHAKLCELRSMGVADVIVDPGFGFAKTVEQNYELADNIGTLSAVLDCSPILVGFSRKSMIYKPLEISPADALPGTVTLNTLAMQQGAAIIRVHDVAAAVQARNVWIRFNKQQLSI